MSIRKISIDEILTYQSCPARHHFEYVKEFPDIDSKNEEKRKYNEAIRSTFSQFFLSIMDGKLFTIKEMRDVWAKNYTKVFGEIDVVQDILLKEKNPFVHNRSDKDFTKGIEIVDSFWKTYYRNYGTPIVSNYGYELPMHGVLLVGTYDLIRETKEGVSITKYSNENIATSNFLLDNDLTLTVEAMAFQNTFGKPEDFIEKYYLRRGRTIVTNRSKHDKIRAENILKHSIDGIQNEVVYPNQSYSCLSCPYQDVCSKSKY